jgi:hypothetical protein
MQRWQAGKLDFLMAGVCADFAALPLSVQRALCGSLKSEGLGDGSHREGVSVRSAIPKAPLRYALTLPHTGQDIFTHTMAAIFIASMAGVSQPLVLDNVENVEISE